MIGVDLILSTRPEATTGIERYALNLFSALRKIAPDTVAFVDSTTSLIDGPGVVRVGGGVAGWLSLPEKCAFRRHSVDILLCPAFPPSPLLIGTGTLVARIIHDDFPWTRTKSLNLRGRLLFKHFESFAAPRYHSIYAPTELMARNLSLTLGREVHAIGNAPGIDLDKAPGSRSHKLQIIAVGTIEPRKNYEALLGTLAYLPPEWTAAVVGRRGWGAIVSDWEAHVAASGERLSWYGRASDDDLLALYQESACFMSMSLAEGFNMPLVEAGSLGLPMVVSDIEIHRTVAPPWACFVSLSAPPAMVAQAVSEAVAVNICPDDVEAYRRSFSWDNIARNISSRLLP